MIVYILLPLIVGNPVKTNTRASSGCTGYLMDTADEKDSDYIKICNKPSTKEHLKLLQLHVAEGTCFMCMHMGVHNQTYMITYRAEYRKHS